MLFHYHHWTPHLEETERFYKNIGFNVYQRLGKWEGAFQSFNPPLSWNDLRDRNILFRIIEMKKGNVNITFGYGKKVMFDHIGLLVSQKKHDEVCKKAESKGWDAVIGERRTFISTPFGFKVELQTHEDVIEESDDTSIQQLRIQTNGQLNGQSFFDVFPVNPSSLEFIPGERNYLVSARLNETAEKSVINPNGVEVLY